MSTVSSTRPVSSRSVIDIVSDLLTQVSTLASKETRLARVEMSENIRSLALGLALMVGGAVLLIPALVILLLAGVAALHAVIGEPWSSLIVGGAAFLIGLILLLIGLSRLKAENLIPDKTINQIQEDAAMARRQMRTDHAEQRAA